MTKENVKLTREQKWALMHLAILKSQKEWIKEIEEISPSNDLIRKFAKNIAGGIEALYNLIVNDIREIAAGKNQRSIKARNKTSKRLAN